MVAEVLVDHPGKDNLREFGFVFRLLGKEIDPGFDVDQVADQHLFDDLNVTTDWNPLVGVVKVVVVVSQADLQATNNEGQPQ